MINNTVSIASPFCPEFVESRQQSEFIMANEVDPVLVQS